MKRVFSLFLFTSLISIALKAQVSVAVTNASREDFKNITLNIYGKNYEFKDLKPREKTKPFIVPQTYRYCYIKVITSNNTIISQPIDYVGEKLYTKGHINFKLNIKEVDGKQELEIVNLLPIKHN